MSTLQSYFWQILSLPSLEGWGWLNKSSKLVCNSCILKPPTCWSNHNVRPCPALPSLTKSKFSFGNNVLGSPRGEGVFFLGAVLQQLFKNLSADSEARDSSGFFYCLKNIKLEAKIFCLECVFLHGITGANIFYSDDLCSGHSFWYPHLNQSHTFLKLRRSFNY